MVYNGFTMIYHAGILLLVKSIQFPGRFVCEVKTSETSTILSMIFNLYTKYVTFRHPVQSILKEKKSGIIRI